MDAGNRILVTVLDNKKAPVRALDVTVRNDLGNQEQEQTNKDGKLIVPVLGKAYTDETGTAIVGKYTVIVTDSGKKPVVKALVSLIEGKNGAKDAFTIQLPDGRLLDANDKTTVTVLLPFAGLNVKVLDKKDNHAAKDTDKAGQIVVPDAASSGGKPSAKIAAKRTMPTPSRSASPMRAAERSPARRSSWTIRAL
ncbi:MAG: hypothetical protein HFE88_08210 [Acutalibacter sp.]|nr:hypothetical protein [Acutalibacter sp.]